MNFKIDLYDVDGSGSLTTAEVKAILHAMLDLLVSICSYLDQKSEGNLCIGRLFFKSPYVTIKKY